MNNFLDFKGKTALVTGAVGAIETHTMSVIDL